MMKKMNTDTGEKVVFSIMDEQEKNILERILECITCSEKECYERRERFSHLYEYLNAVKAAERCENEQEAVGANAEDYENEAEYKKKQKENYEKKRFDELLKRNMVALNGKPDESVIQFRGTMMALSFATVLLEMEEDEVIQTKEYLKRLVAAWNNEDYSTIYLYMDCVMALFDCDFELYKDFQWIESCTEDNYIACK